jgi:hypothetical protein
MRRTIMQTGIRTAVLASLLGGLWLAAAVGAEATALGVAAPSAHAALGGVVPVQAPPGQNVEAGLAQLHRQLGITPAQETAFAAFANVMRENARRATGSPPPANADAVYQLQAAIQFGQQEVDGMRRMLPALQSLYAALTPQQRAVANQVFQRGPGR